MATTFSAFEDLFIAAYKINKSGSSVANAITDAQLSSDFTHLFELVEQRVGRLATGTGVTYTIPGSGNKVLKVVSTVSTVTKVESKNADAGTWTEIATSKWTHNATLNTITAYDTSEPFYFYDVVGGNIRLTVNIGFAAWTNFPTKLQGDIINIARNYYQMLDNVDSSRPDADGSPGINQTNFTILEKAFSMWRPYPQRVWNNAPKN